MIKKGGHIFIFILATMFAGFFCTKNALASQSILISEVQISGGSGKTENDFIELYNPNNSPVNLKGYRLVKRTKTGATDTSIKAWAADVFILAGGYYLWANSDYTEIAVRPNATTTATISDDNGIAIRFGAADAGAIIDSLAWGEAENLFIEGAVFPTNPGANQSLERKFNLDTDNNSLDFSVQANPDPQSSGLAPPPTAQCGNGQVETGESCDDGNLLNGDGCSLSCQTETATSTPGLNETATSTTPNPTLPAEQKNNLGEVVINEFVSDPADNEVEWVELYNKTSREINLSGWWLEDGSKAKTKLTDTISASGSGRYLIVEKPKGVLNNEGDLIILFDGSGRIIDQAVYGNWNDGNLEDNAPTAHDPASVARKFDGYNTFNNANDLAVTIRPTKGASNMIETEDEIDAEAKAKFDFTSNILISEILPNPTGDDSKLEFIEIHNSGQREVNLTGWSLSNEDNKKVNLEKIATSTIIKAGEYLALFRPKTKIILRNEQGEVRLFKPLADKPFTTVAYKNVKEDWSYNNALVLNVVSENAANNINAEWTWSEIVTPGAANVIKAINHLPEVDFSLPPAILVGRPVIFDGSDTADIDGDSLKYTWDFGDGFKNSLANPEHTFFKSGIYQVKLAVSDDKATTTKMKSIKVLNSLGELGSGDELVWLAEAPVNDKIIINEILPNPAGADMGEEWLELKNQGQARVNLINWRVENENGKYKFKNDLWLEQENFYLLTNAASKLAFKNSADTVSLYNDLDELADTVAYASAVQGEAYARGANGKWFWTTALTPARENVISLANSQSASAGRVLGVKTNVGDYLETELEKIKELEPGSLVKVKGLVAVEPGILGVQIFYIAASSTGIQIYNYKKDFPALKVGDYIEVSGELAQTQAEFRVKIRDKNDIKLVGHQSAPSALALSCDAVSEEYVGQLIAITGEITDKKAATAYLDDGSGEILVYFKQSAGLETKSLKAGQAVVVTGILNKTPTGLRLLPRYQEDIVKIDQPGQEPQVLGEAISGQAWAVAERDKKIELFKYLLIIAGGVIIVLVGLFIKASRHKQK